MCEALDGCAPTQRALPEHKEGRRDVRRAVVGTQTGATSSPLQRRLCKSPESGLVEMDDGMENGTRGAQLGCDSKGEKNNAHPVAKNTN